MAVDLSGVGCVTIGYNGTTGDRTYVVEGAWNPATCYGSALMLHGDFRAILEAADSGASSPSPSTSAFTEQEVAALKYQAANPSPFNLSIPDGSLVSGAIAGTWALAWVLKQLVRALNTDGEKETS